MSILLIDTQQQLDGAPSWVRDQMASSQLIEEDANLRRLRTGLPGVEDCFEVLLDMLPDANNNQTGEFPVAAGVVKQGTNGRLEFVSRSLNKVKTLRDSTAHAEMMAMRLAQDSLVSEHLNDAYLLSTCEPCAMCSGAIEHTKLSGLLFATSQADMRGTYARISGVYKPFRASPESFSAVNYLTKVAPEILIVGGLNRRSALQRLQRINGSFASFYQDPDER